MAASKRLMGEISKARDRDEFTDFVLICGAERFPVHKIIVCSQSRVFHAACSKPFKEAASGEYEIAEQSPAIVKRMVDYFYTGDYKDCSESTEEPYKEKPPCSDEELTSLCIHARVFALADMYQVDRLQSLAVTKYGKALEENANIADLLGSIPVVYQLTPPSVRALRDKAIIGLRVQLERTRRLCRRTLFGNVEPSGDWSKEAADTMLAVYDVVADESPEFLKDLLSSYIRSPLLGQCYHCDSEQLQPTEALQMKCLTCGKGGAKTVY